MTIRARLFRQPKSAMQSGHAQAHDWILEWEPRDRHVADPIMGWVGSGDTRRQLRLHFDSREEAEAYAARNDLALDVEIVPARVIKPKAYADNFKPGRRMNWTH